LLKFLTTSEHVILHIASIVGVWAKYHLQITGNGPDSCNSIDGTLVTDVEYNTEETAYLCRHSEDFMKWLVGMGVHPKKNM
ncbi:hypothetical protein Pfo_020710, partial [Paulownia fortunei]